MNVFARIASFFRNLFSKNEDVIVGDNAEMNDVKKGNKYALLVGINDYPGFNVDLRGCVNDVNSMWSLLVDVYDFEADNIRVLTDERATKKNIIDRLELLIEKSKSGDNLVFHYSGHGSKMRCRINNDELDDDVNEILIPYDHSWDDPFTDDIIAEIFKKIPEGVEMTFVADCCHSGTISRSFEQHSTNRFLMPPIDIDFRSRNRDLNIRRIGQVNSIRNNESNVHYLNQNHILISGCKDNQTSADAFIDGKHQGALTAYLVRNLTKYPELSWEEAHEKVVSALDRDGYTQTPQLTGSKDRLKQRVFSL